MRQNRKSLYVPSDEFSDNVDFVRQIKRDFARLFIENKKSLVKTSAVLGIPSRTLERWRSEDEVIIMISEENLKHKPKDVKEVPVKSGISLSKLVESTEDLIDEIKKSGKPGEGKDGLTKKEKIHLIQSTLKFQADMYNKFNDEMTTEMDRVGKIGGEELVKLYIEIGKRIFDNKYLRQIFRDIIRDDIMTNGGIQKSV